MCIILVFLPNRNPLSIWCPQTFPQHIHTISKICSPTNKLFSTYTPACVSLELLESSTEQEISLIYSRTRSGEMGELINLRLNRWFLSESGNVLWLRTSNLSNAHSRNLPRLTSKNLTHARVRYFASAFGEVRTVPSLRVCWKLLKSMPLSPHKMLKFALWCRKKPPA